MFVNKVDYWILKFFELMPTLLLLKLLVIVIEQSNLYGKLLAILLKVLKILMISSGKITIEWLKNIMLGFISIMVFVLLMKRGDYMNKYFQALCQAVAAFVGSLLGININSFF